MDSKATSKRLLKGKENPEKKHKLHTARILKLERAIVRRREWGRSFRQAKEGLWSVEPLKEKNYNNEHLISKSLSNTLTFIFL